jgi:excisionase family DNA binding protein
MEHRLGMVRRLIAALEAERASLEDALDRRGSEPVAAANLMALVEPEAVLHQHNTLTDVAAFVGLSPRTVRRAISAGDLQVIRPSPGTLRISADAVHEWLKSKSTAEQRGPKLPVD